MMGNRSCTIATNSLGCRTGDWNWVSRTSKSNCIMKGWICMILSND